MNTHIIKTILCIFTTLSLSVTHATQQNKTAGKVEFSRGIATAQKAGDMPRILGKGEVFFEDEVLSTSDKSFIIIHLTDKSRMTLRPNTEFAVERINANQTADDDAILRLFKGGMRTVTGFIGKLSKKTDRTRYQIKTPVATIGIRGTEFDARICDNDCKQTNNIANDSNKAAARIAFIQGQLISRGAKGENRELKTGDPVYEGDTLATNTNSFAVLLFSDNSRISLQPETLFRVERFRFKLEKAQPEEESAILHLVKGGLRAITGLMGKSSPRNYLVKTPVATIGIRGTGFDLQCQGKCIDRFYNSHSIDRNETFLEGMTGWLIPSAYAQTAPDGSGLFAHVWSGSIEFQLENRTLLLSENQTAFLPNHQTQPQLLPELPPILKNSPAPRPDKVDIQSDALLQNTQATVAKPGLYVSVEKGEVDVDNVRVLPGEAVFAGIDNNTAVKLETIPEFIVHDPFPKPGQFDESTYKLLPTAENSTDEFECEIR